MSKPPEQWPIHGTLSVEPLESELPNARVGRDHRVTVPKEVRDALGIGPHATLEFVVEDRYARFRVVERSLKLEAVLRAGHTDPRSLLRGVSQLLTEDE